MGVIVWPDVVFIRLVCRKQILIWLLTGYTGRGVRSVESGGSLLEPRDIYAASSGVGEPLSCPGPPPGCGPRPVLGPSGGKPPAERGLGFGAEAESGFRE